MVSHAKPRPHPPWSAGQLVGGHPALDLVNTVSDRVEIAQGAERLGSLEDLSGWLLSVGLITPAQARGLARLAGPFGEAWLEPVRGLREAAWRLLGAVAVGQRPDPEALRQILLAAGAAVAELGPLDDPAAARLVAPDLAAVTGRPDGLLALLALQVLDAYLVLPRDRLRCCPRCGWLFYDRSRGGRRRWCKMATCGNREKASRHYGRRKTS